MNENSAMQSNKVQSIKLDENPATISNKNHTSQPTENLLSKSNENLAMQSNATAQLKENLAHHSSKNQSIKSNNNPTQFDIITAFHVIEHLQDPITILRQLASLLKDKGKIIIEVPNANDALLTIYQNKAFQEFTYWSPHLYLYSPHTLRKLGEKAGLKVEFVKGIQRYPLSNTLYWLSFGLPAGQKKWGNFLDNKVLQESYESSLAALGATDTLIAQFSKSKS